MRTFDYNYQNSFFFFFAFSFKFVSPAERTIALIYTKKKLKNSGSCNKIMSSCNCPIQSIIDVPVICRATGETTLESRGYFFVSSYREKKAFELARRVRIAKILQKMLLVLVARLWWILKSSLCKSWG